MHGKTAELTHTSTGIFASLNQPLTVTRYHSLIAEAKSLPDELEVVATCDNQLGNTEIMAVQHKTYPLLGVQFHPESVLSEQGHQLLANFIALSADI